MELSVSLETLCRIIVRARELEAQVPGLTADEGEDPLDADDEFAEMDEETNTVVEDEITTALDDLAEDQLNEVLALAWIGRGTYDASEWTEALEEAGDRSGESPIDQLLEMPMLAGYLDAGLAAFDLSCDGIGSVE